MKAKSIPYGVTISNETIQEFLALYPKKDVTPDMDLSEIMFNAGRQDVIYRLEMMLQHLINDAN